MAYDSALAERVRAHLAAVAGVGEKKMFGGIAFLTYGNMTVGVYGEGLLARIDPQTMRNPKRTQGGQEAAALRQGNH
jgi:TfoX/Sxy family transcriptional regulator of competence genes